jgi:ATP-binding cassette, subfamily C (CFTR/MRP), member 1
MVEYVVARELALTQPLKPVGLLIIWSANFTITLGFLVDTFSEAESAITAVERVDAMTRLPTERPMVIDDDQGVPPPSWPAEGRLEFRDVCLRYRDGLPLALDNLSFSVPPGKSVGVVGRTGAGSLLMQSRVCHACKL